MNNYPIVKRDNYLRSLKGKRIRLERIFRMR